MYDSMGGIERGCLLVDVGVEGGGRKALVCVLLILARSMSFSMFPLAWLPVSWSLSSSVEPGSRISRRPSLSAKPSCQLALAHQPTTSSLILSNDSLFLIISSTQ